MENDVYRSKPRKSKGMKWIPLLLILGIYVFRQLYLMNANSVDTVKASEGYINDSIVAPGIICREEKVLIYSGTGVVDYLVENGERISKGQLLVSVYPHLADIENLGYMRNRQQLLEDIQLASEYIHNTTMDMSVTRKQLSQQLSVLSAISHTENFNTLDSNLADLTLQLNKIGVATGRVTDFTQAENQIKSEISAVKAGISNPQDNLYSNYTGYFIQSSDGYENIATVDNFINSDYQYGENIINGTVSEYPSENRYGKIITDYKWNVCTYIDKADAASLKVGNNVRISIESGSNEYHKAVVNNIVDKGDKVLVVLQCSNMNSQAASDRIISCEILFKQYTGIKIPKTALRFDGEQMGVFVNFSNLVQFKKITPAYEDEKYIIVPVENSRDNQVKLHDSIIVKGRNLYDGKYL